MSARYDLSRDCNWPEVFGSSRRPVRLANLTELKLVGGCEVAVVDQPQRRNQLISNDSG